MARGLNKIMLIGNVGQDPEVRLTPSGTKLAKFSLATNWTYTDQSGQKQESTQWHRLTFWAKLADIVEQWVKKGDRLYVEGRVEYSQTEDEHGQVRYWTDVVVQEMVMLGSTEGRGENYQPTDGGYSERESSPSLVTDADDDLPF